MKKISFAKLSGAGNDFIFFDKKINPGLNPDKDLISKICARGTGIGADGVIVISDKEDFDFEMQYYNSDGSTNTLCGNGARCAIRYAYLSGRIKNDKTKFFSNGKIYHGEVIDPVNIKFFLNEPEKLKLNFKIKAFDQLINASYLNTGSPHAVINIEDILKDPKDPRSKFDDINEIPVFELGKEIRYHKDFTPDGLNVNFIQIRSDKILIRTYERGVENETLACGTGATAAAIILYLNYGIKTPVTLVTKSGFELKVDFAVEDKKLKDLSLTGHAEIVFTGEFFIND